MMDLSVHVYEKLEVSQRILEVSGKPVPTFNIRPDGNNEITFFFTQDEQINAVIAQLQKLKRGMKKRRAQENVVSRV